MKFLKILEDCELSSKKKFKNALDIFGVINYDTNNE